MEKGILHSVGIALGRTAIGFILGLLLSILVGWAGMFLNILIGYPWSLSVLDPPG
jgi:hypothetical protein